MIDLRCGVLWAGEGWVMVTTTQYGDLVTMNTSPEVSDVRLQAMRRSAHHNRTHFMSAVGDDDELRMWLGGLSDEQIDRLQDIFARMP